MIGDSYKPVIPSIFGVGSVTDTGGSNWFSNSTLKTGEVKSVHYPEESGSPFITYDVIVQHVEDGGGEAITTIYKNCILADTAFGCADYSFKTLRTRTEGPSDVNQQVQSDVRPEKGSKVLILCLNGAQSEAVILSGMPDKSKIQDYKSKGHHLTYEFNGVYLAINNDGSFSVTAKGPTDNKGAVKSEIDTKVEVTADGDFNVTTANEKEYVKISHANGQIEIDAPKIKIGSNAPEAAVLGDTLVQLLSELCSALAAESHPTLWGPTGPPLNAATYLSIQARLRTALSTFITVKK